MVAYLYIVLLPVAVAKERKLNLNVETPGQRHSANNVLSRRTIRYLKNYGGSFEWVVEFVGKCARTHSFNIGVA